MNKVIFLFLIFFATQSYAQTIITYMSKEDSKDTRKNYNVALLKLAFDKTIAQYGPYKLIPSENMNYLRARKVALKNDVENFIYKDSVTKERITTLGYVPFPVDRGIVGYRIFFVSPQIKDKLKTINNVHELKNFTMLQGLGWLDTKILKYSGFSVIEGSNYKGLFGMLALGRADLFPRGANEILYEYNAYKDIENLDFDTSIALYYPLPRFFFTNKNNKKLIERLEKGIIIAYEDGSLEKLWNKYYKKSIDFVNLKNRKLFKIENPFLDGIDNSYEKYIYKH